MPTFGNAIIKFHHLLPFSLFLSSFFSLSLSRLKKTDGRKKEREKKKEMEMGGRKEEVDTWTSKVLTFRFPEFDLQGNEDLLFGPLSLLSSLFSILSQFSLPVPLFNTLSLSFSLSFPEKSLIEKE